ncbi:MAG TPA: hypothetical protein VGJ07_02050 [Rugosimonospora sp.]
MGKLVVVEGDPVRGTDTHNVSGMTSSSPPVAYTGVGDYQYTGSVTDALSDFVTIGGVPVALVSSKSSLDPGQTAPPAGGHSGPAGSNFAPPAPAPNPVTLSIVDSPLGTGVPNAGAGSGVLTVGGVKVLLDSDKIDTCSGIGVTADSTVTAQGQSFVTCSQ